jgi:predicted RNA-binding protein with PIN domain
MAVWIVDGHSVIFAWPELRQMHREGRARARETLVRWLGDFAGVTGDQVAVVFDGTGARANAEADPAIQVFYSALGQTADAVIERLVARYARERRITVVTDDGAERVTVEAFGAEWAGTESFRQQLEAARGEISKRITGG